MQNHKQLFIGCTVEEMESAPAGGENHVPKNTKRLNRSTVYSPKTSLFSEAMANSLHGSGSPRMTGHHHNGHTRTLCSNTMHLNKPLTTRTTTCKENSKQTSNREQLAASLNFQLTSRLPAGAWRKLRACALYKGVLGVLHGNGGLANQNLTVPLPQLAPLGTLLGPPRWNHVHHPGGEEGC